MYNKLFVPVGEYCLLRLVAEVSGGWEFTARKAMNYNCNSVATQTTFIYVTDKLLELE